MIDENIRVLYSVEPGLLWAGTLGGGLIRIEIEEQGHGSPPKLIPVSYQHDPEKPQTLCHNDVVDIFEDRSGVLWIATFGGGLSKFSLKSERFRHYRRVGYSGNQSAIRSVYEDRSGTLWIGVDGGGLLAYDRSGGSINSFQHDPNNATSLSHDVVSAIAEDESGNLWVGTRGGGLNRFDLTQNRFFHYQHDEQDSASLSSDLVHAVVADDQGALWIGTDGGGLNRFDPKTERFESFRHDPDDPASLVHSSIQCVCRTRDRMLWIGTWKGLSRLDPINRKFVNYRHDPEARASLPHPTILSIYEDRSGMIWLASHGGGVIRFDPKKEEFQQFTEHDGLANNVVYGVLGDEYDNIWLCTKNGLSKLNTKSETFRNYYKKDGLVSNLFYWGAYHKGREGELFVGGMEGLNSFFPLPQNTNKPTVAVTGFRIFDQDAAYKGQNIELSYKENFISFEFAVLDYQDPSRNQFSCKLEGLNEDWIYCGTRNYINYTNLDGGDYVFRVKGGNIDGNWNDMHAAIHVRVIPPVWKRKWFYVLEIILVIAAAMGVTLYIRRRIRYEMDFQRKTNELNYARELQIAMLPRSDVNLPKMEIMGKMITASEVGGDYYDFIPLDDHRYCVALGDATGHGVAAGLVVGMIKMALNTSVQKVGSSSTIEELVLSLNSALLESISQNYMGMSFSIAIIDQKNLHVQISSTGMPYPYYYQADTKKMIPIELNGPPLGILEDITVQTHNFHAELGDMLVLLSDGFVERFDEKGEMWGFDALEESLEAIFWEEKTAGRVMDSLIQACDKFANRQENDDDMTVVAIRFRE
ncbi:MAG: hypothetical protein B6244_02755 [Candidatus Cloacimonetes bacterium 4572_55]|nr:MAG: hypothetical protein B6244_02755 [Candidatus Cloacimonetes bacterium 4572_55]